MQTIDPAISWAAPLHGAALPVFPRRLPQERPVLPARSHRRGHTPPIPDSALRGLRGGNSAPARGTLAHPKGPVEIIAG